MSLLPMKRCNGNDGVIICLIICFLSIVENGFNKVIGGLNSRTKIRTDREYQIKVVSSVLIWCLNTVKETNFGR